VFAEPDTYQSAPPPDDYLRRVLGNTHLVAMAAYDGSQTVGGLVAYELPKLEQARSELYIYDLAVAETHRRRGIATALIGEVCALARAAGAWTVFVQADTIPDDEPARALYRKLACAEITALNFDIAP
jgi:aminoglycoside 3-N-acetyltransferase I